MLQDEYKLVQRMTPMLQKVLIVDPFPASTRLLSDLMRNICPGKIWTASSSLKAIELTNVIDPQLIFAELDCGDASGIEFTRRLRRSDALCRQAPVIMVTATATAAAIMAARDAGVHEFLRKPYTTKDLLRRLEAVTLRRRDWVEAVQYIGPDRRRFNSGDYSGPLKRRSDAKATPSAERVLQALKILRAAVGAIDTDPKQALRAMLAQAVDLQKVAATERNIELAQATTAFQRFLVTIVEGAALTQAEVAARAAPLLAFLPADTPAAKDAAA